MILLSLISILINPLNDGGTIVVTDEGSFACLSVDTDGNAHDAWQFPDEGVIVVTPNQIIIYTDEHDVAMSCSEHDLINVDCVDQEEGLLSPPLLMEALGDIRRNRSAANCPLTCGDID